MRKIWPSGFQGEDRTKNIDNIYLSKVLRSDILQSYLLSNSGIVNYDVDLKFTSFDMRKFILSNVYQMRRPVRVAHVSLHRYRLNAMG